MTLGLNDHNQAVEWGATLPVALPPVVRNHDARVPLFGEDSWHLDALGKRSNQGSKTIYFAPFPSAYRAVAKRLVWTMINRPMPDALVSRARTSRTPHMSGSTIYAHAHNLKHFLQFVDELGHIETLSDVTQADLETYFVQVKGETVSGAVMERRLRLVVDLHHWTEYFPEEDRLGAAPWEGTALHLEVRPLGNATPEMPLETLAPLLLWAELFLNELSTDILTAAAERQRMLSQPRQGASPTIAEIEVCLARWLSQHDDYLPGTDRDGDPTLAAQYLLALGGVGSRDNATNGKVGQYLKRSGNELPLRLGCPMNVPITGRIEGQPWIDFIDFYDVDVWVNTLREACLIVVLLGTALRGEEALTLTATASRDDGSAKPVIEKVEQPNGQAKWLLHGRLFKGQLDIAQQQRLDGVPVTWVTVELGATAFRILIELAGDDPRLFVTQQDNFWESSRATARMRDFVQSIRKLAAQLGLPSPYIPPPDADDFMTTRVMRRTTSVIIQQEQGGVLAGAWQAKHLVGDVFDTRVTTGYGSTARVSNLKRGVRTDQSHNALTSLAEQVSGGSTLHGPGAERALAVLHALAPGGDLMSVVHSRDWDRKSRRTVQKIYPVNLNGAAWFCVYDASKAACTDGEEFPDEGNCQLVCSNKCYTSASLADMRNRQSELALQAAAGPEPIRDRARRRSEEYAAEIARAEAVGITLHGPEPKDSPR